MSKKQDKRRAFARDVLARGGSLGSRGQIHRTKAWKNSWENYFANKSLSPGYCALKKFYPGDIVNISFMDASLPFLSKTVILDVSRAGACWQIKIYYWEAKYKNILKRLWHKVKDQPLLVGVVLAEMIGAENDI